MGKWQDIPPIRKPNWDYINEGQRRYAYEQYNLARVRRGLPIDHPVPGEQGQYNHRGDFDIDAVIDRPHPDEQRVVEEFDDDTGEADPSAEEILSNLPNAPENDTQEFDESYLQSDPQGSDNQRIGSMADSSMGTPTKGTGKRGSTDANLGSGGGGKRLPGTARGQGEGGGNTGGEDSVRPFKLPKPNITISANQIHFIKVHRFFTYGYAYKMFPAATETGFLCMSSPLAMVPWDWLHFYMNPSEHALLPPQASVRHVKCSVYQRNVRVAFPTNSSANALATLNQNKNVVYAVGLNKRYDCRPIKYTGFTENQTMIPNAWEPWKLQDMQDQSNNWYGDTANINTVVPRHQVGQPDVLPHYAGLVYQYNPQGVTAQDGWESLQNCVEESDADVTAGGLLCTREYSPAVGLCSIPMKKICRRFSATTPTVNRGSYNVQPHTSSLAITNNGITATSSAVTKTDQDYSMLNSNVQLIEKSQIYNQGVFKVEAPRAQDSLHIGVQPTYALTSTSTTVNNSFTDTQAYFEIVAECWVDTCIPTRRPLTTVPNDTYTDFWQHNTTEFKYELPLLDGLHVNSTST